LAALLVRDEGGGGNRRELVLTTHSDCYCRGGSKNIAACMGLPKGGEKAKNETGPYFLRRVGDEVGGAEALRDSARKKMSRRPTLQHIERQGLVLGRQGR